MRGNCSLHRQYPLKMTGKRKPADIPGKVRGGGRPFFAETGGRASARAWFRRGSGAELTGGSGLTEKHERPLISGLYRRGKRLSYWGTRTPTIRVRAAAATIGRERIDTSPRSRAGGDRRRMPPTRLGPNGAGSGSQNAKTPPDGGRAGRIPSASISDIFYTYST